MNRVNFIESVSGINYPEMIVNFFDHFIALKQLIEGSGKINVINSGNNFINFSVEFDTKENRDNMIRMIDSVGGSITIYGRSINITLNILNENSVEINLS